jgi:aminoglycoside phosphotransferase (APT) family kinase protein
MEQRVETILKKHFPNAEIRSIKQITEGYTHYMFDCELADKNVIARIGMNKEDKYSIAKELFVMQKYVEAGVPVPKVFASDFSRSDFPFEYAIMEKLPGECITKVWKTLSDGDKKLVMFKVGELLARLHSVKFGFFGDIGKDGVIEEEEFSFRDSKQKEQNWKAVLYKEAFKQLSNLITIGLLAPEQSAQIAKYLHMNVHLLDNAEPVLVHNDFHPDHIFIHKVSNSWEICGICDFEFASAFAREFDFIKLHRSGLLQDFKSAILAGYGTDKLHPQFDKAVELYRLTRDMGFARFVAKANNPELAEKTVAGIMRVVSR